MNENVKILDTKILSEDWCVLKKVTFEYLNKEGTWQKQHRESYMRGNAAAILLYNREKGTVILTRQFRMPAYLNGNDSGLLIEVCAGLLDDDNPEDCIIRETEEETGFRVTEVKKVFEAFMSPGSLTEVMYFFIAEYTPDMKVHEGGGVAHEQEEIEVLEIPFGESMRMIDSGEIKDAKTIMLLQHAFINNLLS